MINKIKKLGITAIILLALDALTTFIAVGLLGKTELNPINYFFFGNVIISVAITHIIVMYLCYWLVKVASKEKDIKGIYYGFIGVVVMYIFIILNNIVIIFGGKIL